MPSFKQRWKKKTMTTLRLMPKPSPPLTAASNQPNEPQISHLPFSELVQTSPWDWKFRSNLVLSVMSHKPVIKSCWPSIQPRLASCSWCIYYSSSRSLNEPLRHICLLCATLKTQPKASLRNTRQRMLWLCGLCSYGIPNCGSRGRCDSFACLWDPVPPTEVPHPGLV